MDILISIFKLLGGLALLIYGMKTLSTQLKKLSGSKLEQILTNVTDKYWNDNEFANFKACKC